MIELKIRYGISTMSLWPWSMFSISAAISWVKQAGYDILQVLPQRGIDGKEKFDLPATYLEGAWNPVHSPLQALRHQNGANGTPGNIRDWLAFPSPEVCDIRTLLLISGSHPRKISHSFRDAAGSGQLVEICPELDMTPEDIAHKCRTENYELVLDTEHLLRDFRTNDPRYGRESLLIAGFRAGQIIEILAPYVRVVHLKGRTEDATLVVMLLRSNHLDEIDCIAEYPPLISTPKAVKEQMNSFLSGMKQLCES